MFGKDYQELETIQIFRNEIEAKKVIENISQLTEISYLFFPDHEYADQDGEVIVIGQEINKNRFKYLRINGLFD